MLTAVIGVAVPGGLLQDAAAALGALAGHLDDQGLRKRTVREAGAGQEAAKPPGLHHHLPPAHVADLVGDLVGDLDAGAVQVFLGLLHLLAEVLVEIAQDLLPVLFAILDFVQAALHVGGEGIVHDVLELVLHQARDHLAQRRRVEVLAVLDHILPVHNGGDGGGIGRGAANALLLQRPDEGGLGVARGGLGKLLLRPLGGLHQRLALLQVGQAGLDLAALLVLALFIHGQEAGELDLGAAGFEDIARAGHLDVHAVVDGVCHLAGQKAAPDQLVQPELLGGQVLLDALRGQGHVRGPDGLVGVLRPGLGLEVAGGIGQILLPIPRPGKGPGSRHGFVRQAQRVGTHVGDKTHGPLPGNVHAFVQLLGDGHGAAGAHVELSRCLLLQGGGDERGGRRTALVLPLDLAHGEGGGADGV